MDSFLKMWLRKCVVFDGELWMTMLICLGGHSICGGDIKRRKHIQAKPLMDTGRYQQNWQGNLFLSAKLIEFIFISKIERYFLIAKINQNVLLFTCSGMCWTKVCYNALFQIMKKQMFCNLCFWFLLNVKIRTIKDKVAVMIKFINCFTYCIAFVISDISLSAWQVKFKGILILKLSFIF